MRALFVTPSETGSGEAITALHMAEDVLRGGGEVHFLTSRATSRFVAAALPGRSTPLTGEAETNRRTWAETLRAFRPSVVVFADFPLLFFTNGASPLADEAWLDGLRRLDAALVTLDHLGYAQGPMSLYFGPPHLCLHAETLPAPPPEMEVLLPCPVQDPEPAAPGTPDRGTPDRGRRGRPFRCWDLPLEIAAGDRRAVRRRCLDDPRDLLIFHSVPAWAWKMARRGGLPYFEVLSRLLEVHLAALPRPVTVISVNNGALLAPSRAAGVRFVNLDALPRDDYQRLLLAADLMLTENGFSVSLGKAVCGLVPCALLRNSHRLSELLDRLGEGPLRRIVREMEDVRLGAVFPWEVFPIFDRPVLERLGLRSPDGFAAAFAGLEVFGEETGPRLRALLTDSDTRERLRVRQRCYVDRLRRLPSAGEALAELSF